MGLFDRFRKSTPVEVVEGPLRKKLVDLVLNALRDKDGRIRAEDAISAAATIVGERCIDLAADYPLRDHDMTPGARAFSTKANELICGEVADGKASQLPADSVVGVLRARLDTGLYPDVEFPVLSDVFRHYAACVGNAADWGKVPLSVGEDHLPFIPPLRVGYETRGRVDDILLPVRDDKARCLRIATQSLADILVMVASAIDHQVALTLAIETINGMAKTAPMTARAMQQAQADASHGTGPSPSAP
jgi:hypothetical protein